MARVPFSDPACPLCGARLEKAPQRKTRCRSCNGFMFIRTQPSNRSRVIVSEEEAQRIDAEWADARGVYSDLAKQELGRRIELEAMLRAPLKYDLERLRKRGQGFFKGLFGPKPIPIRWVLGTWCAANCRRIAGIPSCQDMAGEWPGGWGTFPVVPGGAACHSDEFLEWWYATKGDDAPSPDDCDCDLEMKNPDTNCWERGS